MGGSESKSKAETSQKLKNKVVNRSSLNYLNQVIVDTIVNVTIRNVKSCSASIINSQKFEVLDITATGDVTLNITQIQQGMLNFDCIQKDTVQNEVTNTLINTILNELKNSVDTQTFNDLDAKASSKAEADWLALASKSSADSKTKQDVKNEITNENTRNIKSLTKYTTNLGFTNENFNSCVASVINQQQVKARNINSGANVSFTVDQKQATTLFSKCVQNADIANKITNSLTNFYGLTVNDDVKNSTSTTATGSTSADALTNGPIGAIGSAIAKALSPFTDLLGLGDLSSAAGSLIFSLCSCSSCIIVVIIVISLIMAGLQFTK